MAGAITNESANQARRQPPAVDAELIEIENLPSVSEEWEDMRCYLPVDHLLLTVKDIEFQYCLTFINKGFVRSCHKTLGTVYFGYIGEKKVVKVAVIKCHMGAINPGGSGIVVLNAVRILRPKAVFNVGFCASLNKEKAKLGDVIVSSKIVTYASIKQTADGIEDRGIKVPLKTNLARLINNIGDGWKPPLKNATDLKVKPRRDGVFLSGPEVVDNEERRTELIQRYREATAIEMEGEGLYAAANDLDIEWIVIKGVSDFADGSKKETAHWRPFASAMAASLVAHTLKDASAFESWPHFKGDTNVEDTQPGPSTRGEPLMTRVWNYCCLL